MSKKILVDASYPEEVRVVVLDNKKIQEYDCEFAAKPQLKGNIYLAKITRVEPSLQAAFIDYGADKHGFLPFSEIHPSYFNIPVSERTGEKKGKKTQSEDILGNFQAITPPDLSDLNDEDDSLLDDTADKEQKDEVDQDGNPLPLIVDRGDESSIDDIDPFDEESEEGKENNLRFMYQKYKIQEVVKKNQIILVQAIKEERGNKGASFTSFISLAGRYCVLMPNSNRQGGISRRIIEVEKRKRLKRIIDSLNAPDGISVIIRTAGEVRAKGEIKRDYDYLVRLWNSIREHTIAAKAPAFIHAESDVTKRAIRDLFDSKTSEIIVQGEQAFKVIRDFTKKLAPAGEAKIKNYKEKTPLFHKFRVEEQISSLYGQISPLDSGGYLVINTTEALTSIDVNSGKSTSERNIEETAVKTNIEAAREVARQLRLRDISGLIVIDFIDMGEYHNRKNVERTLRESLKADRARIQVSNISPFGLVEMSRQRLSSSFSDAKTVICSHCNGKGRVREPEINALIVLRTIENEVFSGELELVTVYAHIDVVLYILNFKREHIKNIETKHNVKVQIQREFNISVDSYSIELVPRGSSKSSNLEGPTVHEEEIEIDDVTNYEEDDEDDKLAADDNKNSFNRNRSHDHNRPEQGERNNNFKRRGKPRFGENRQGSFKRYGKRTNNSYRDGSYEEKNKEQPAKKDSWWNKIFG